MRVLRRLVTLALLLLSIAGGGGLAWSVLQDPLWQPFRAAAGAELRAALDRDLARQASPERLASLIETHLAADPRNWVALQSLRDLAAARGIALPMGLVEAYDQASAEDAGWVAQAGTCAACAWDMASCPLNGVLLCQVAVQLTPVGDVAGLTRGGLDWYAGREIDRFDVVLSATGLAATAAVLVTGGGSAGVKAGAAALRLARGMGRLSAPFTRLVTEVSARAIDFAALHRLDFAKAIDLRALDPLLRIAGHADEIRSATDLPSLLHLLPLIDDAQDASKLALVTKVMGKETVAAAEILGKTRLLRASLRWSDAALQALAGVFALLSGLAQAVAMTLTRALRRLL